MRRVLAFAAALLAAVLAGPARAQEAGPLTGTLKAILDRGTFLIGVRPDAVPFSFRNRGGQPIGFSVDLCHGVAEDVAEVLGRDLIEAGAPAWQTGLQIVYVPVAAETRLAQVTAGAVDIECGSTTANAERSRTVAFSPVFFLAGTKLLVPAGSSVASFPDLAGRTVAVNAGTTNAAVIQKLAAALSPPATVSAFPTLSAAYDVLAAGRADALASDDILLAGTVAAHAASARFRIVGDYLSYEPYGLTIRRDDPDFAAVVQRSFARMAEAGTLRSSYARWFEDRLPSGERLALPMGPQLTEMYRSMGQPD